MFKRHFSLRIEDNGIKTSDGAEHTPASSILSPGSAVLQAGITTVVLPAVVPWSGAGTALPSSNLHRDHLLSPHFREESRTAAQVIKDADFLCLVKFSILNTYQVI